MAKTKILPTPKTKREVSIAYIKQAEKAMSDEEFSKWSEVLKEIDNNKETYNTQQKKTNAMKREFINRYLPQLEEKQLINLADIAKENRDKEKDREKKRAEAKKRAEEKKKEKEKAEQKK